jgi:exodeoxyribonuclease-3
LEKDKPVVVCGDFNAAHEEIDIARPKTNHHSAGFTDEERRGISNIIGAGLIDTFRSLNPDSVRYTWWSHWGHARENNVGWRIDYFFVSKALMPKLKTAEIYENVMGSDHCPISIELEI